MIDTDWNGLIVVVCDECDDMYLTAERTVHRAVDAAIADGWDVDSNETVHCPECKEKHTP